MVNAGETTKLVNADKVTLTNFTDSLTFGQLYNLQWNGIVPQMKKAHIDGSRDSLDRTPEVVIQGDIFVTQPEITTWIGYNVPTGTPPQLVTKSWDLGFTAFDGAVDTIRIVGKVNGLQYMAPENDGSWYHVTITSTTGVITEP